MWTLKGEGSKLYEKPVLHERMPVWETKMDTLRAGGNCLIIHLVASMDIHYVMSPLRKTKEERLLPPEDVNIPHTNYTRIGFHVGFHQVNGHFKMSIIYCDIISVPPSLLCLCCPLCNMRGPLCIVNWSYRPLTRIAHFMMSMEHHDHRIYL